LSFQTIVSQLQACLGSASIFTGGTAQISISDDKIYTKGKTPVAVIEVTPGLQHIRESFGGGHLHVWNIPVTVGAQWRDATLGPPAINAAWQGVLDQICKYPNLGLGGGGAIREAHVASAMLRPVVESYGTLKFANVQIVVSVTEDVVTAEAE